MDLRTLPHVHGEPKQPRFGESTRVFIRHTSTALVPTSSVIPIFGSQTDENIFTLPSSDATIASDTL